MHTPIVVFATLASGSICHHWQSLYRPQSDAAIATAPLENRTPKNATSGRGKAVFGSERFFPATQSLPPPRESSTVTIVKQHPYLRCRLTGVDGDITGLDLTTWRACGGSRGRAGTAQTWLKMKGGQARTIYLRRQPLRRTIVYRSEGRHHADSWPSDEGR
jgi:hypothetical protein